MVVVLYSWLAPRSSVGHRMHTSGTELPLKPASLGAEHSVEYHVVEAVHGKLKAMVGTRLVVWALGGNLLVDGDLIIFAHGEVP